MCMVNMCKGGIREGKIKNKEIVIFFFNFCAKTKIGKEHTNRPFVSTRRTKTLGNELCGHDIDG